jgi:Ca-activated chloride channel family protein
VARLWAQRRIGRIIDEIDLNPGGSNKELMDELVELSKVYGVLTPYTSFLALDNQDLNGTEEQREAVSRNLRILRETSGGAANAQRANKQGLLAASRPAPAQPSALPRRSGSESEAAPMSLEAAAALDEEVGSSRDRLVPPIELGGRIFYEKNGRLVDASMDAGDLRNPTVVVQFSGEYYRLAERLQPDRTAWLSRSRPVLFKFEGRSYLIEPAAR